MTDPTTEPERRSSSDTTMRRIPQGGDYGAHANAAYKLCMGKHKDYGPGNIDESGVVGVMVRLGDKMARFRNIVANAGVTVNDSPHQAKTKILAATAGVDKLEDDLLDIANYAIIARMWLNGQWGRNPLDMYGPAYYPSPQEGDDA